MTPGNGGAADVTISLPTNNTRGGQSEFEISTKIILKFVFKHCLKTVNRFDFIQKMKL